MSKEHSKAFQDFYSNTVAHCYGCGRLNEAGLQIKTHWEGEEAVTYFKPQPFHTAVPGYVYGGLIASLFDCHGTGTAAAAAFKRDGRAMDTKPAYRYVTASLHVDYLKPTPLIPLTVRGRVKEIGGRKVIVESELIADGDVTARAEVVAVQMPQNFAAK